jgi:hypothetical protein
MKRRSLLILASFAPVLTRANGAGNPAGNVGDPTGAVGNPGTVRLVNPLKSESLTGFLLNIIDVLLTFAIPIIVLFIMYGGLKLVTARGDTGQIEEGKKVITWAVIGGVIVLASKLIIQVIQGTVSAL